MSSFSKETEWRDAGVPMICPSNLEQQIALCYPWCSANFYGVGPVCWQYCLQNMKDCGTFCVLETQSCFNFVGAIFQTCSSKYPRWGPTGWPR